MIKFFCIIIFYFLSSNLYAEPLPELKLNNIVAYEGKPTYGFYNQEDSKIQFVWSSRYDNYTIVCLLDALAVSQCSIEGDISANQYIELIKQ